MGSANGYTPEDPRERERRNARQFYFNLFLVAVGIFALLQVAHFAGLR